MPLLHPNCMAWDPGQIAVEVRITPVEAIRAAGKVTCTSPGAARTVAEWLHIVEIPNVAVHIVVKHAETLLDHIAASLALDNIVDLPARTSKCPGRVACKQI